MEELRDLENNLDGMYQALDAWYTTLERAEANSEGYPEIQYNVLALQQKVLDAQSEILKLQRAILKKLK